MHKATFAIVCMTFLMEGYEPDVGYRPAPSRTSQPHVDDAFVHAFHWYGRSAQTGSSIATLEHVLARTSIVTRAFLLQACKFGQPLRTLGQHVQLK